MNYWLWLRKRNGDPVVRRDNFLPGLVPAAVLAMLTVAFADHELHLCGECTMASRCHVIGDDGTKYCTVLFHDAVRPAWPLERVE